LAVRRRSPLIPTELARALASVSKRQRISGHLHAAFLSLAAAWIATSLTCTAVRLAWGPPPPAGAALVFTLAAAAAAYVFRAAPLTDGAIARMIDHRLDLKDRLSTALEYKEATSAMAAWLMDDAEQKARFVDPGRVVPLPPPLTRRGLVLLIAVAASTAVWFVPLPSGVFSGKDALAPPQAAELAADGEIFERAAKLMEELRYYRSPELQRIQRDLAELQAGLRDRSLPRDEAVALLNLLERRARNALAFPGLEAGERSSGPADLDRLQDLANRLVAAASAAGSGNAGAFRDAVQQIRQLDADLLQQNPELNRLLEQLAGADLQRASDELTSAASNLQESIDRSRMQAGGEGGDGDREAGGQAGGAPAGDEAGATDEFAGGSGEGEVPGNPGEYEDEGEYGGGASPGGEQAEEAVPSPDGGSTAGAGSQPGGEDSGTLLGAARFRELYYLPGSILDGPVRTGVVQTSFALAGEGPEVSGGAGPAFPAAPVDAEAVDREQIPLAYRQAVRRYFQSLEPGYE